MFGAGVNEGEESIAAIAADFALRAAADLVLDDVATDVAFGAVRVEPRTNSTPQPTPDSMTVCF
jgi:hypothetical protein